MLPSYLPMQVQGRSGSMRRQAAINSRLNYETKRAGLIMAYDALLINKLINKK